MRLEPVNLLAGFNRDDSPAWSVQDVCNFLPVVADQPGTTTQFKLRTPPGLKPYQRIGSGPIRGEHNAEGRLFVVSAQTLYEVSSKGVGIPRGTVPGVGRVRMAHNQIKNGNQIAIANGQSGYIYNTVTQAFARITDDGFPGAVDVVFINGYLFWIEPFGRYWLHSDLADGLSYNTLDRGEAESQPDRIVGVAVSQGDVLLFGERTTEFYRNTGQATGTFQSTGTTIDVGCASRHTIQNLDNSVMWLGNDGVIYRLDGLRAVPISTRAIEKAIAQHDWANAFAFTWEDEGHKVYYITFPDGETFGYDVVVGLWHRRESFGFSRWRLNSAVSWGRKWIGCDFQDGRLWILDWEYLLEGDDELVATYTTAEVSDSGNRIGIPEMALLFDVGRKATVASDFPGQPVGPSISGNAPDGVVGDSWPGYTYSASGGTPPYRFKLQSGMLPAGVTLSTAGVLSAYTPTKSGESAFVVRVVDVNELYADVSDSINIQFVYVARPQAEWRYKQIASSDSTDYSSPSFDDSSWAVGQAPFGSWEDGYGPVEIALGAPDGFIPAHAYDSRFAVDFASFWEHNTRLWMRTSVSLLEIPAGGVRIITFIEDHCTIFVNGTEILSTPPDPGTGTGQTFVVAAPHLVAGSNVIAIRCDDEAPGPAASGLYADFIIEAIP